MVADILELIPKNKASHSLKNFWPSISAWHGSNFLVYVIKRVS